MNVNVLPESDRKMKKLLLFAAAVLPGLMASAQHTRHAVGAHLGGSTIDLEYQYHFSTRNFLDVTAGVFDLKDAFSLQGIYNWNVRQWPEWTPRFATWKLWGGAGGGIGFYGGDRGGVLIGPVGTLGFGFTLKEIPLTLGLDYRPMVALVVGDDFDVLDSGFRNIGVTLTWRF